MIQDAFGRTKHPAASPRGAFTLIEVMVVLSVLALTAALAYNLFANTVRDATVMKAAVNLAKDMNEIEFAFHGLIRRNGADPTGNNVILPAVTAGIIKAPIDPDDTIVKSGCVSAWSASTGGYWIHNLVSYAGSPTNDWYTSMQCIPQDVCLKFNEMYSTVGATIPADANNVENQGGRICYGTGAQNWDYTIFQLLEVR